MVKELYLIESVHVDLDGPERLGKLLDHLEPNHISTEYDLQRAQRTDHFRLAIKVPGVLELTARNLEKLFRGANPETARKYLEISDFEYFVTKGFCLSNQMRLWLIDNYSALDLVNGLMDQNSKRHKDFVETMSMTPTALRRKVDQFYSGELPEVPEEELQKLKERDNYMANVLRNFHQQFDGKIVHVGGMVHTRGPHYNLYDRLIDLGPKRIKLNEADRL